jgi:hypothetical protein
MLLSIAIIIIGLLWLSVLTFLFLQLSSHYNNLTKGTHTSSLQDALGSLLQDVSTAKKDIDMVKSQYDTMKKEASFHIQKIGLLRFNPFNDTGGDQSFILTLLDKQNTGVVISGLYSRSGTRWYAKKVIEGKGVEHELSGDEKKAIHEAK